jgi:hypothetical protein
LYVMHTQHAHHHMVAASVSKFVAMLMTYPFQVMRTRIQVGGWASEFFFFFFRIFFRIFTVCNSRTYHSHPTPITHVTHRTNAPMQDPNNVPGRTDRPHFRGIRDAFAITWRCVKNRRFFLFLFLFLFFFCFFLKSQHSFRSHRPTATYFYFIYLLMQKRRLPRDVPRDCECILSINSIFINPILNLC